jgi:hypothetical protein
MQLILGTIKDIDYHNWVVPECVCCLLHIYIPMVFEHILLQTPSCDNPGVFFLNISNDKIICRWLWHTFHYYIDHYLFHYYYASFPFMD